MSALVVSLLRGRCHDWYYGPGPQFRVSSDTTLVRLRSGKRLSDRAGLSDQSGSAAGSFAVRDGQCNFIAS